MAKPPVKVLTPDRSNSEVALFSTTPVTLAPITALINVEPAPVPELVIVPALLTEVVESVRHEAIELLLFSTRLPVPIIPPETVSSELPLALLFVSVVPELFTVIKMVPIVNADAALFSVIPVTFEPTPPRI